MYYTDIYKEIHKLLLKQFYIHTIFYQIYGSTKSILNKLKFILYIYIYIILFNKCIIYYI